MNTDTTTFRRGMLHLCALACIGAFATGCPPRQPPTESRAYFGPTETMAVVAERINANNSAIPTLRATGFFDANVVDRGRPQRVSGDVTLLYRRPDEVRLVARKDIAGTLFEAASNGQRYWLIVKGDIDTMWHGSLDSAHRVDPRDIPIRPDLLIEVLGITEINPDFLSIPAPTMRFDNDADAYVFSFNIRMPDRWAVQKEVWYDRQTLLPARVVLFDEHGRVVLRSDLSEHRAVDSDAPRDQRPRVATRFELFFPDSGTTLRFDLNNIALRAGRPPAPYDRSFVYPGTPGVSREIDLDEQPRL